MTMTISRSNSDAVVGSAISKPTLTPGATRDSRRAQKLSESASINFKLITMDYKIEFSKNVQNKTIVVFSCDMFGYGEHSIYSVSITICADGLELQFNEFYAYTHKLYSTDEIIESIIKYHRNEETEIEWDHQ